MSAISLVPSQASVKRCSGRAKGSRAVFSRAAARMVRLNVALIVAPTDPAARAAKQVTSTTPIVTVLAGDPVAVGWVRSLARPGGNVTGLTAQATDWSTKLLQA